MGHRPSQAGQALNLRFAGGTGPPAEDCRQAGQASLKIFTGAGWQAACLATGAHLWFVASVLRGCAIASNILNQIELQFIISFLLMYLSLQIMLSFLGKAVQAAFESHGGDMV